MRSYEFGNLDEVGIDLICNVFNKMLSDEMVGVGYFNYNNYEWCVGVDVVRRINDLNGHHQLPNSILGIQVIKSYAIKPNEIALRISPRLYEIDEPISEESKKEKEGNTMPTNYNKMFLGTGNLYFRFKAEIKNVIFNNPATIILWNDGTKTVVKCREGEVYDPEKGLAMAIAKKFLGNQGNYHDTFKKWLPKEEKKEKVKTDTITPTTVKHGRYGYATVKELAKKVGVSESTIRGQIRKGQFPGAIKQDGVWLIPVSW